MLFKDNVIVALCGHVQGTNNIYMYMSMLIHGECACLYCTVAYDCLSANRDTSMTDHAQTLFEQVCNIVGSIVHSKQQQHT